MKNRVIIRESGRDIVSKTESKKATHVYDLNFIVRKEGIVPRNLARFEKLDSSTMGDKYENHDVYRYRFNKKNVTALDIDRFTTEFDCEEHMLTELFVNYDITSGNKHLEACMEYEKHYSDGNVFLKSFDILYKDPYINTLIGKLDESEKATFDTTNDVFVSYRDYIWTLLSGAKSGITSISFQKVLDNNGYVGKTMKEAIEKYNGNYNTLWVAGQLLSSYTILRGMHAGALQYDPDLIHDQRNQRIDWCTQYRNDLEAMREDAMYQSEKEEELFSCASYIEQCKWKGEMGELRTLISSGILNIDALPVDERLSVPKMMDLFQGMKESIRFLKEEPNDQKVIDDIIGMIEMLTGIDLPATQPFDLDAITKKAMRHQKKRGSAFKLV